MQIIQDFVAEKIKITKSKIMKLSHLTFLLYCEIN